MRPGLTLAVTCGVGLLAQRADADTNDLVMSRLSTAASERVIGQNLEFRSLASELGVVLAPHMLTPADTVGFGGFQFTFDIADTTIDNTATYWRARESANPTMTGAQGTSTLRTIGLFARKGIWLPLPSFEIGLGAVHLVDSNIWAGQMYAKFAVVEGYHQLPLPSLAVRGGVSRMMTQRELDLTIASLDITASKHLSIGDTWRFEPFVGWNLLVIIPRSEVIEPTPTIDPLMPGSDADSKLNFVFKDQDNIYRQRVVLGAKFRYHVLQLTIEAAFALRGTSTDDRPGTSDPCMPGSATANCDATDTAKAQRTLSVAAGFDF
ncbi:MAG: hypothetical protein H0T79_06915 [Deltaproteobacteria bacterium]|nr:hypothetical protein [Deltaproteobacteria bacterium]